MQMLKKIESPQEVSIENGSEEDSRFRLIRSQRGNKQNGERDLKRSSVAPSQSLSKERNENLDDGRSNKTEGS
jgi:hypothetical protein